MTYTRDHLFIGDRCVEPEGEAAMPLINPATEEVIGTAPIVPKRSPCTPLEVLATGDRPGPGG